MTTWRTSRENFYPRPPRGGRRFGSKTYQSFMLFLSTPSARRATRRVQWPAQVYEISIHALREEGDEAVFKRSGALSKFLSTPSARRATVRSRQFCGHGQDFYPRPPRGGRRVRRRRYAAGYDISIHALREEGDRAGCRFLLDAQGISIHALREEGDSTAPTVSSRTTLFLSTPSARRATSSSFARRSLLSFLSTPSARRATDDGVKVKVDNINFYPRPPRGGRRDFYRCENIITTFLSTPSARRATSTAKTAAAKP